MIAIRALSALLGAAFLAFGAGTASADVEVVVTSKPIHSLVASVMAGIGSPRLLVDGQASPHTYSLKPSDARNVHGADVLFRVSEQLEPFTGKLVRSLPKSVRVVSLAEAPGLTLLERRQGGTFEDHADRDEEHAHDKGQKHNHAHDHDHAGPHDPHVWLDPENAKAMVSHVAGVLAELAPGQAAAFKANGEAEIARIDRLSDDLERELAPLSGKPFIVYHDAYQYFERRFGLTAAGSVTVSPDLPPSGKRLQQIRNKIASSGALCVFAEPYFDRRAVAVAVEGTKARTGTLDPEGTALASGPDLYANLLSGLAAGLRKCLLAE